MGDPETGTLWILKDSCVCCFHVIIIWETIAPTVGSTTEKHFLAQTRAFTYGSRH